MTSLKLPAPTVVAFLVLATDHDLVTLHLDLQLSRLEPAGVQLVGEAPALSQRQLAHVVSQLYLVEVIEEVIELPAEWRWTIGIAERVVGSSE